MVKLYFLALIFIASSKLYQRDLRALQHAIVYKSWYRQLIKNDLKLK